MDGNTRFLIDECFSPELVEITRSEFGFFATYVPWLGAPPGGARSWKDWQIVDLLRDQPHVLVTNNRRDFVERFFQRGKLDPHEGLIVLLEKNDIDRQKAVFRAVMRFVVAMDSTVNRLIEINNSGTIRAAPWPNPARDQPWVDPFVP